MFTRQHYQKFADILKKMSGKDKDMLAQELITMFQADNRLFNAKKFAEVAGVKLPAKVNESFDGFGMKLMPLLPVGRIESRGTLKEYEHYQDENGDTYDDEGNVKRGHYPKGKKTTPFVYNPVKKKEDAKFNKDSKTQNEAKEVLSMDQILGGLQSDLKMIFADTEKKVDKVLYEANQYAKDNEIEIKPLCMQIQRYWNQLWTSVSREIATYKLKQGRK